MNRYPLIVSLIVACVAAGWVWYCAGLMRGYTKGGWRHWFATFGETQPGVLVSLCTSEEQLEAKLAAAGLGYPFSVSFVMACKRMALWLTVFVVLVLYMVFHAPLLLIALVALPFLYAALRGPEVYCFLRTRQRKQFIERELPQLVDALILYIRAGLNLENAFREFARRSRGMWHVEWERFIVYVDHGMSFKDALLRIRARFPSPEFGKFLNVLEQSRTLGVPLTDVLTIHAGYLRALRRERAEELAKTAAVKIALPLVFFIFPALLIIFLGPAIIQLKDAFSS